MVEIERRDWHRYRVKKNEKVKVPKCKEFVAPVDPRCKKKKRKEPKREFKEHTLSSTVIHIK